MTSVLRMGFYASHFSLESSDVVKKKKKKKCKLSISCVVVCRGHQQTHNSPPNPITRGH